MAEGDQTEFEDHPPSEALEALAALLRDPESRASEPWPIRVAEALVRIPGVDGAVVLEFGATDPVLASRGEAIDPSTTMILDGLLRRPDRKSAVATHESLPGLTQIAIDHRRSLTLRHADSLATASLESMATLVPFAVIAAERLDGLRVAEQRVESHRQVERHIAESLSSVADLDGLGRAVIRVMSLLFDVEQSAIYLRDPGIGPLRLVAAHGFEPWEQAEAERTAWERHPGRVIRTGRRFLANDVRLEPTGATDNSARRFEIRSRCWIPVVAGGEAVGALGAASPRVHAFGEEHVSGLQFLSDLAGLTWSRLLEQARRQRRDEILVSVGDVARILLQARDWKEAMPHILRAMRDSFGFESAQFIGADGRRESVGENVPTIPPGFVESVEHSRHGGVTGSGNHPIPGFEPADPPIARPFAAVPVIAEDRFHGLLLGVDANTTRVHDATSVAALRAFVEPLGAKISRDLLSRSSRRAERMDALGQLAGGVAHDINNLLMPILGLSSTLASSETAPDRRDKLHAIQDAALQGREFVENVLLLTRKRVATGEHCELDATVASALAEIGDHIPSTGVEIEFEPSAASPVIGGDRNALQRTVEHLVRNASEAIEGSTGRIRIRTAVDETNGVAVLSVEDDGEGMGTETREHVFDPFFTTRSGRSARGLGLTIVHRVVSELRGSIAIDSREGEGTTITVRLPLATAEGPAIESAADLGEKEEGPTADGWILVVDDDELVRTTTVALVESFGHRVRSATGGEEALRIVAASTTHPPRLVLTDLNMPGMDGVTLVSELRASGLVAPCAIITGFGEDAVESAEAAGADLVIRKPISRVELGETVDRLLRIRPC